VSNLTAAREAIARYTAGELILPTLLRRLEGARQAAEHVGKGTIIIATLEGDVHDIGRALLIAVLSNAGYTVHDLGKQVPVSRIVEAAVDLAPDAIGLSALLVTTSRQMPRCIQALDAHGLHLPVLVGGAAINRAFGRRSAILPDGRIYEPGVFYSKDVFEGLATLDSLLDPGQRDDFISDVREAIQAERDQIVASPPRGRSRRVRSAVRADTAAPSPPYWGPRVRSVDLRDVWHTSLDRNTLFRFHWGGYRVPESQYPFEPTLQELTEDALSKGWLEARVVSGYFPCNASGDDLLVYSSREVIRLSFPRQPDGERLCLADYFKSVTSGQRDVVALQAVSCGPKPGQYIEALLRSGQYERMLLVNGLASATAEALAEYAHRLARQELGLPDGQGLRFSWGYAACPDLDEQRKVLPLLHAADAIGLTLTQSSNLDPEHSTAAIIVHHPDAKYFAVRA
jgi:5-methyltetrahydrofolate--homocysteine methyltransferase